MSNVKIFADIIEPEATNQVYELAKQLSFKDQKIRIMPDVHSGKGCVIGFTSTIGDYVIPNIVGVDIGCGMLTTNLGNINLDLEKLDKIIHKFIPSGTSTHNKRLFNFDMINHLYCKQNLNNLDRIYNSIGTLGGGNHFIEVDINSKGEKYLVIHTGSRNLGKQVAEYYQDIAYKSLNNNFLLETLIQEKIIECKNNGKEKDISLEISKLKDSFNKTPKDLAYLTGTLKEHYLHDMGICQEYAKFNRGVINTIILGQMNLKDIEYFHTIHNYIDIEHNIVRKGAISAYKGEKVLIPMNMRDGCILGVGKGNEDWNCSAPHSSGRLMSRSKAKENVTLAEFQESMKGIYSTSICNSTIDESPMAYKDKDSIINIVGETIDILDIIKPIYNFKATK